MSQTLTEIDLPKFSTVALNDIEPSLDRLLADNRHKIIQLLTSKKFTWDTLIQPFEDIIDRLHIFGLQ